MKNMIEEYGTDHWYEADGYFAAGRPPWLDSVDYETLHGDDTVSPKGVAKLNPAVVDNARIHAEKAYGPMVFQNL